MKVIVIGSGPAGVSTALYARRDGAAVTVITKGAGFLATAERIENYYGFPEPISGPELERRGIAGAKRLGVTFEKDEALAIQPAGDGAGFFIEGVRRNYTGDAVVLAAGAARRTLAVSGVKEFEGRGVSYCAICDAFFYRGKNVAVIGAEAYALHEAQVLLPHAAQIVLLTNGAACAEKIPDGISVVIKRIARIEGERRVQRVVFEDGSRAYVDGVFMAIGMAGSLELARKMGVLLRDGNVVVGAHMETNVPGIYAAGDCTGGLLQVAKAVYEGAEAGLAVVRYLRKTMR